MRSFWVWVSWLSSSCWPTFHFTTLLVVLVPHFTNFENPQQRAKCARFFFFFFIKTQLDPTNKSEFSSFFCVGRRQNTKITNMGLDGVAWLGFGRPWMATGAKNICWRGLGLGLLFLYHVPDSTR
jgi:hypothetical protein